MYIPGEWHLCDDGIERPVVRGEALALAGTWEKALFLVDTGADRTVLSADVLAALGLATLPAEDRLGGLGGVVDSALVQTTIRLPDGRTGKVTFQGQFAAVSDAEALDMSVLGRDITGLFAVIVDLPAGVVCMVGQRHRYVVQAV